MNMAGISTGAVITTIPGKSADSGHLGSDIAVLAIFVFAAIILQLWLLHPIKANKTDE